ncbi:MAG: ECF transporter S component, partial [Actinomycetes bacterium]
MAAHDVAVLRLRRRSAGAVALTSAVGLAAFLWPLFVDPGAGLSHDNDASWLFVLLLPLLLAVVLAEVADGGMDAKAVALLGVLAAVGAVLRPLSGGATGAELIFFLLLLAGRVMGPAFGFVLGALTLFASALLTAGV